MNTARSRVLLVDDHEGSLALALGPALARHDVEVANDVVDALCRIDCAAEGFGAIFCDVTRGDVPGPELWAYLSRSRRRAAMRVVFVSSGLLSPETRAFLARVPNVCLALPVDHDGLHMFAARRAAPGFPLTPTKR